MYDHYVFKYDFTPSKFLKNNLKIENNETIKSFINKHKYLIIFNDPNLFTFPLLTHLICD